MDYDIAINSLIDENERKYLEARILLELPPQFGRNLGKALLLLESLKRIKPELSSTSYFIARSHIMVGNQEKAIEELNNNITRFPNDSRTKYTLKKLKTFKTNELLDIKNYGWSFGMHYSSLWGASILLKIFDDAIMDKNRMLIVSSKISSKPRISVNISMLDKELLDSYEFGLSLYLEKGKKDFYETNDLDVTIDIDKRNFEIFTKINLYKALHFSLGWRGSHLATYGNTIKNLFYSGPFFKFSLQNIDSLFDPKIGEYYEIEGYFPTDGLLSSKSFEKWHIKLWKGFYLGKNKSIFFDAIGKHSKGDVPIEEYPYLGEVMMNEKYKDKNLIWARLGYRTLFYGPFDLGIYTTLGSSFSNSTPLWRGGGGIRFIVNTSNSRKDTFELQTGLFEKSLFMFVTLGTAL